MACGAIKLRAPIFIIITPSLLDIYYSNRVSDFLNSALCIMNYAFNAKLPFIVPIKKTGDRFRSPIWFLFVFHDDGVLFALGGAQAALEALRFVDLKRLFDFALGGVRKAGAGAEGAAHTFFLVDIHPFDLLMIGRGLDRRIGADVFALTAAHTFFRVDDVFFLGGIHGLRHVEKAHERAGAAAEAFILINIKAHIAFSSLNMIAAQLRPCHFLPQAKNFIPRSGISLHHR